MKITLAALLAVASITALASTANAAPHRRHVQVCNVAHHHRVCHWVWR